MQVKGGAVAFFGGLGQLHNTATFQMVHRMKGGARNGTIGGGGGLPFPGFTPCFGSAFASYGIRIQIQFSVSIWFERVTVSYRKSQANEGNLPL